MSANITSIASVQTFQDYADRNLITLRPHPQDFDVVIANYTPATAFSRVWDEVTMASRGLIFRQSTGEILARPFRKFFNWGQPEAEGISTEGTIEVANKEDGSLGILYRAPDGRFSVSTRGSMASEQALHATDVFRDRYEGVWTPDEDYTFLYEIIYPEGRIVLDYSDMDDLILLGAVNNQTGRSVDRQELEGFGWPGPIAEIFEFTSLDEVFRADQTSNKEGFVIHFTEQDERLKVKFEEYLAIHRLLFNLSERRVWEMLSTGADVDQWLTQIPDEFATEAKSWVQGLRQRYADLKTEGYDLYRSMNNLYGNDRKAIAMHMQKAQIPKGLMSLVFGHVAQRDEAWISDTIWKQLRV